MPYRIMVIHNSCGETPVGNYTYNSEEEFDSGDFSVQWSTCIHCLKRYRWTHHKRARGGVLPAYLEGHNPAVRALLRMAEQNRKNQETGK
ncbi:hypothetical protein KQI63_09565 [bacterium]|nr:hypothetical protein [bacterium]